MSQISDTVSFSTLSHFQTICCRVLLDVNEGWHSLQICFKKDEQVAHGCCCLSLDRLWTVMIIGSLVFVLVVCINFLHAQCVLDWIWLSLVFESMLIYCRSFMPSRPCLVRRRFVMQLQHLAMWCEHQSCWLEQASRYVLFKINVYLLYSVCQKLPLFLLLTYLNKSWQTSWLSVHVFCYITSLENLSHDHAYKALVNCSRRFFSIYVFSIILVNSKTNFN